MLIHKEIYKHFKSAYRQMNHAIYIDNASKAKIREQNGSRQKRLGTVRVIDKELMRR